MKSRLQSLLVAGPLLALAVLVADAEARPPAPPAPPDPPSVIFGGDDFSFSFSSGRGRLGAHVSSMTPELRSFFGAPNDTGILVQKVLPGTPAEDAGLAVGDVVTRVDGDEVTELGEVMRALDDRSKGDKVAIEVVRKKKKKTLTVTLTDAGSSIRLPHVFGGGNDEVLERLEQIERRLDAIEGKKKGARPARAPKVKSKK